MKLDAKTVVNHLINGQTNKDFGCRKNITALMAHNKVNLGNFLPTILTTNLHLSNDNLPCFLIESLIIPVWIEVRQFLGQSVMFSHPNCVVDSQSWLFIAAAVTSLETFSILKPLRSLRYLTFF